MRESEMQRCPGNMQQEAGCRRHLAARSAGLCRNVDFELAWTLPISQRNGRLARAVAFALSTQPRADSTERAMDMAGRSSHVTARPAQGMHLTACCPLAALGNGRRLRSSRGCCRYHCYCRTDLGA